MSHPSVERPEPVAMRDIDSPAAIKALADPLRLKLLHLVMSDAERSWTVKELAAGLDQPVTKLYHHVKQLEQAQLILDVESRLVSGIVEHRYRAGQRGLRFDDALFRSPSTRGDSIAHTAALVAEVRDELVHYLDQPDSDAAQVTVLRSQARLTAAEVEELNDTVEQLLTRFRADRDEPRRRDLPRTSIFFAVHPLAEDAAGARS